MNFNWCLFVQFCSWSIKRTIKMFHSCFGTDWLLVGQGGISLGLSCVLVCVDVNGRLAESAVNLDGKEPTLLSFHICFAYTII